MECPSTAAWSHIESAQAEVGITDRPLEMGWEPDAKAASAEALISIAISLARIADKLSED